MTGRPMRLWKVVYMLDCPYTGTQEHTDKWWSTTPPTITTPQHLWDVIFPGNYTVTRLLEVTAV